MEEGYLRVYSDSSYWKCYFLKVLRAVDVDEGLIIVRVQDDGRDLL